MSRILKIELKRALNKKLLIGIMGVFFCICFDSWNDLMYALGTGTGSVHYFFWNSSFGGVCRMYLLPSFSGLAFATSFCLDYKSQVLPFIVSREGKEKYCIVKYIINALCGGMSVGIATALLIIVLLIFLPITDGCVSMSEYSAPYHFWLAVYYPFGYIFMEIGMGILRGILWSSVTLCISAFIPDVFVTIISPYLVSFFVRQSCRILEIPREYQLDKMLLGSVIRISSIHTFVICLKMVLCTIILLYFLFRFRVKRRIKHELYG